MAELTGTTSALFDPQALYRQWEECQWSPWEFDLRADRDQWEAMEDRSLVVLVPGSLMVAEERITTKFSALRKELDLGVVAAR